MSFASLTCPGLVANPPLSGLIGLAARCIHAAWAFGAAARAAIFAGVQPSRLILRELPISEVIALGYSQYSVPGWIVVLALFSPKGTTLASVPPAQYSLQS